MLVPSAAKYCKGADFVQAKSSMAVKKRILSPPHLSPLQPLPLLASLVAEQQQQQPSGPAEASGISANRVKLVQSAAQSLQSRPLVALAEENCRDEANGHCCRCCCKRCCCNACSFVNVATPFCSSECPVPESATGTEEAPGFAAAPTAGALDLVAAAAANSAAEGMLPSRLSGSNEEMGSVNSRTWLEAKEMTGYPQCQMAMAETEARSRAVDCTQVSAATANTVVGPTSSVGPGHGLVLRLACRWCANTSPEACNGQQLQAAQCGEAADATTSANTPMVAAATTGSGSYAVRRRPLLPLQLESRLPDRLNMGNRLDTSDPGVASAAAAAPANGISTGKEAAFVDGGLFAVQACTLDSAMADTVTVCFPPPPSTPPSDDEGSSSSSEDCAATGVSNEGGVTEASLEADDNTEDEAQAGIPPSCSCRETAGQQSQTAAESFLPASAARWPASGASDLRQHRPSRLSLVASFENGQLTMVGAADRPHVPATAAAFTSVPDGKNGTDQVATAAAGAVQQPSEKVMVDMSQSLGRSGKAKPELARMRLTLDLTDSRLPWESYNPARRLAQLLPVPLAQHDGSGNLFQQQRRRIGYDPWFASLPSARKARSAEPPSPHTYQRSALYGSGCTDLDHGAPRSPTLLDELHRRYYGSQKSPGALSSECNGSSEAATRAPQAATPNALAPPTIILPSNSSLSPLECSAKKPIIAEKSTILSSDSSMSHMNMFGDVDKMFRGQASGQPVQSPIRCQSHDQSPTAAASKSRNQEGQQQVQLLVKAPAETIVNRHLAPPLPKLSASGVDGVGHSESASAAAAAAGASSQSRVAKLSRAFSLSPQILRRKYRPVAAAVAADEPQPAAAATASPTVPTAIVRDRDEHHGSSLPASLRKKKTQEIEVLEACSWLAEVGFPQYLQMFEEGRFPLELSSVEKDHAFLETCLLHCLCRRLAVLNRCAHMKLELTNRKLLELLADDDQQCALSDKWRVNQKTGRWLRIDDPTTPQPLGDFAGSGTSSIAVHRDKLSSSSSSARCGKDMHGDGNALAASGSVTLPGYSKQKAAAVASHISVRPSALLRSLGGSLRASRRARRQPLLPGSADDRAVGSLKISSPVLVSSAATDARLQQLGCVDIGSGSSGGASPISSKRSVSPSDALNNNDVGPWHGEAGDSHATSAGCVTSYLLPANYVPGTFPLALSKAVSMPAGCRVAVADTTAGLQRLPSSPRQGNNASARIVRSVSLRQQRSLSSARGDEAWLATNRHSIYDNVPSAAAVLVGCSDEVTQLELALRELLELSDIDRDNDRESSASPSPPLGLGRSEDARIGTAPDSASMPNFSPPATRLREHGVGEKAVHSADAQTAESRTDAGIEPDIVSACGSSNHEATSDQDAAGSKEDLSSEATWHRERRDSGVGSSLTREPSEGKKKPRLRWHSFVKSHRPSMSSENVHVARLPAGQLMVLQKLCKLYISSALEDHCVPTMASQHAAVVNVLQLPKFVKRVKAPDYSHRRVFGVPLSVVQQRSGQPLPQCILYAMRYLRKTATDAVGIFRKSGVKSRIEKLHDDLEANPDTTDFEGLQAYDVADLLKKYFRELPECLLTNKLSQTFLAIQQCVSGSARLEAMQACTLLMPCENREAFEALLCFLSDMADHAGENQMTASNLAVCFAPSLFDVCSRRGSPVDAKSSGGGGGRSGGGSSSKMALPDQKELLDQKTAHECLTHMIANCRSLFKVPEDFLAQCHCSYMEAAEPLPLATLSPDYRSHVESCIQGLLKESREGFKGWDRCHNYSAVAALSSPAPGEQLADVELWSKKVGDGNPLRLWRASVEIEAPPVEVLDRVLRERHLWDEDFAKWRTVEKLDADTEVFQYACSSVPPQPQRDYVELRSWRTTLPGGACLLVSHSVDCPSAQPPGGGGAVRGVVLASSYLIEPCGTGRSRLTHVSRVDMRGRPPDWYGRHYGHLEAGCLVRLRDTFRRLRAVVAASASSAETAGQQSNVPETSV